MPLLTDSGFKAIKKPTVLPLAGSQGKSNKYINKILGFGRLACPQPFVPQKGSHRPPAIPSRGFSS
jgi:hypothetical protein